MTTWPDVVGAEPGLAELVRRCFAIREHATLRADGSPRISGTEVELAGVAVEVSEPPADGSHRSPGTSLRWCTRRSARAVTTW